MYSIIFFLLGITGITLTQFAPTRPERWFVMVILLLVVLTNLTVLAVKQNQPKPVNWLTGDVLFTLGFSLIHFGYFFYWVTGFFDGQQELWYFGYARVPHVVCLSLAMFLTAINAFLLGYNLTRTKRYSAKINEYRPPLQTSKAWGRLGRFLVRVGFALFVAFILIVGPAVYFGNYAGSNVNRVGNVLYQLGQVILVSGMTIAMVSRERFVKSVRRKHRLLPPISILDLSLIAALLMAIGLHGDRSLMLTLAGAAGIAYSEYVRPVSFRVLAIGLVTMIFLLGLIMVYRSGREVKFDFVENANNGMVNMGTSAVCSFVAVDYCDNNLSYGRRQVLQLLGIIPFGRRLVGYEDNEDTNSSVMLTKLIQGSTGKGVAGTGTSAFADFYFDFGFGGTVSLFFLIGALTKFVQNSARCSTSLIWQVVFINLVAFLAICGRYSFSGGFVRYVIYSGLYTVFFCYLTGTPMFYSVQKQIRERMRGFSEGHRQI